MKYIIQTIGHFFYRFYIWQLQRALLSNEERMSTLGVGQAVKGFTNGNIVLSNDVVLTTGFDKNTPGACANGNGFIYVNEAFLRLDGITQYALIKHEEGHLVKAHHNLDSDFIQKLVSARSVKENSFAIQLEHEADVYALYQSADMLHGLRTMQKLLGFRISNVAHKEIDLRCNYIAKQLNIVNKEESVKHA